MRLNLVLVAVLSAVALSFCSCASGPDPEQAIEHYVDGEMFARDGKLDDALNELAKAVDNDPELSIAYAAAGSIHFRREKYKLAEGSFETACKTNPYSFAAHYKLGQTYEKLIVIAEAVSKNIIELLNNDMNESLKKEIIELLEKDITELPRKDITELLNNDKSGLLKENISELLGQSITGLLKKVTTAYLRSVELEPGDFDANLNLSACYFLLDNFSLAEQYCKAAIRIDPKNAYAHSNLGAIYNHQNRPDEAVRAYKAALELDVNQPDVLLNLGITYMKQNRYKEARQAYQAAARLDPKNADPWVQIGICHFRASQHDKAVDAYKKAIELRGDSPSAYHYLGIVYMTQFIRNGEKDTELKNKALEAWNNSLRIQPDQDGLRVLIERFKSR